MNPAEEALPGAGNDGRAAASSPASEDLRRSGRVFSPLTGLLRGFGSRIGRTAVTASAWSAAGSGISMVLRFISRLVLAKLLLNAAPMGDIAIITVVMSGLEMISDLGINYGVVQHRKAGDQAYLGTAFSVQVMRGVLIWAIASALAQPVATMYHDQELMGLLLFAALGSLIRSFVNTNMYLFNREMDLRLPTLLATLSEIMGFAVTVLWAYLSPTGWAIIGGSFVATAVYAGGSHLVAPRLRFAWDKKLAREIVHFGGWMLVSSGTYFIASRGESLMLRGSVPDAEFGCFAFATMLVTTPVVAVTQLGSQVFFPMLASSIREDAARAERQFRKGKWAFTAIALCFVWGGMFLGPPIISLMKLPRTFDGLFWMVPLLGIRAALDIFVSPTASALFASGSSRYAAWANIIRLVVLVVGLYLTVGHWGLHGAIWVLVGAPAVSYVALLPGLRRLVPGAFGVDIATLLVFWLGTAAALAIHYWI